MKSKSKPVVAIAPILVLPVGTSVTVLAEARAAGYVPICCNDPSKVVVLMPQSKLMADDLLMAAMHGLSSSHSSSERSAAMQELHRRLLNNEAHK